jgi:hypothetical protein
MPDLLRQHPNIYYTLDTATLLLLWPDDGSMPTNLMYSPAGRDGFMVLFDANREHLLEEGLRLWLPTIEAAPERVLWGTDVSEPWHIEPDIYQRLIAFSRDFIARLPEQYRQGYEQGNAVSLFGERGVVPR